jgi:hypothetical protein
VFLEASNLRKIETGTRGIAPLCNQPWRRGGIGATPDVGGRDRGRRLLGQIVCIAKLAVRDARRRGTFSDAAVAQHSRPAVVAAAAVPVAAMETRVLVGRRFGGKVYAGGDR